MKNNTLLILTIFIITSAGITVYIPVSMGLNETKLVIPDYLRGSVIQMDNMKGEGFTVRNNIDQYFGLSFIPADIDFDARGRIYLTNFVAAGGVIRLDNITSRPSSPYIVSGQQAYALGIDRARNIIYFSAGLLKDQLLQSDYNGNASALAIPPLISEILGIDVDQSTGTLYLACTYGGASPTSAVASLDPSNPGSPLAVLPVPILTTDVAVRPPYVYFTQSNPFLALSSSIEQVTMDLSVSTKTISLKQNPADTADAMLGPYRFVGLSSSEFYVTDEDNYPKNRILHFSDISGSGWSTFIPDSMIFIFDLFINNS